FMKDRLGEVFEAIIIGVTSYGLKVRLIDLFVEGFVHVSYMTDDYYRYDERSISLIGTHKKKVYKISYPIEVILEKVSLQDKEIYFGLA
ncbi:MAG TPA: S1 RNA-binding domain-containing protein, partial [Nitrospirae bacterium]|nr:S1 RNA-binding domain-containing protein [Nitrospirota bacterium]